MTIPIQPDFYKGMGSSGTTQTVLSEKEMKILAVIRKNARISQTKIADALDMDVIINALETIGEARVAQLKKVLEGTLPGYIDDDRKQTKKVSNILQAMKKEGTVNIRGTGHNARWFLVKT